MRLFVSIINVNVLILQRLYKETYEKNKAKVHIIPDMVDIIAAKDAQKKISEIDYRTHLHDWICLPDLQINAHVRKVADQISDVSSQVFVVHFLKDSCICAL